MMRADYIDQLDFFNPKEFGYTVHVIGAGGIGSIVATLLGKNGVKNVSVWDDDYVEAKNIPGQVPYGIHDIGTAKVEALRHYFERQCMDSTLEVHNETVTDETVFDGIVVSGVDSMKSRYAIWEAVKHEPYMVPLYFDLRVGGENVLLLTVDPLDEDSIARYEQHLFPDSEVLDLPCSARANAHTPTTVGCFFIAQLQKFSRGEPVFWKIEGNLASMNFNAY